MFVFSHIAGIEMCLSSLSLLLGCRDIAGVEMCLSPPFIGVSVLHKA